MEEMDGVLGDGVPDIGQFLSVCMDEEDVKIEDENEEVEEGNETERFTEEDIVKVEEPHLPDSYEDMCGGTQFLDGVNSWSGEVPAEAVNVAQPSGGVLMLSSKECPICGRAVSRSKLKVHMRTHTGEKPYQCDICNKCFARSDKLITHKRIHTGEKPHTCFCGKQFRRIDHLKDHFKTHDVDGSKRDALMEEAKIVEYSSRGSTPRLTGPVCLTCSYCGMKFTQSYKYKRHLRVHTGEKPYVCFCGNSYTRSEGLRRHQINFHGYRKDETMRIVPEGILGTNQTVPGVFELNEDGILKYQFLQAPEVLSDGNMGEQNASSSEPNVTDGISQEEAGEMKEESEDQMIKQEEEIRNEDLTEQEGNIKQIVESEFLQSKECPVCGKMVSRSKMKVHLRTHTGERPFQCDICNRTFARSDKLTCHKRIHTGEKPYICFCGKRFTRIDHMKMHASIHNVDSDRLDAMLQQARSEDLMSRGLPVPQSRTQYTCSYCGQVFTQNYKYKRHVRAHTGEKPYACFCGCRYSRSERLRRHQIKCHGLSDKDIANNSGALRVMPEVILELKEPVTGTVELNESGVLESNDSQLTVEAVSNDLPGKTDSSLVIPEPIPPPSFGTLGDIEHVMREVVVEQVTQPKQKLIKKNGMYCCEFCPKTFKKAHKLGLHRRTHTGEKPHLCTSCGKAFARKDHLLKHMNIHLKRRRDSLINAWMKDQNSLVDDLNVVTESPHTSDMGYADQEESTDIKEEEKEKDELIKQENEEALHICSICGHAFRKVYNLQSHMQIHTERSMFECGVCGKQFKVRKNYEAHLLNHESNMDLSQDIVDNTDLDRARSQRAQCTICGKWLVSLSSLETHMRSHTGERPFQCHTCEHTFIRKADMLRHMKSHSGERPYQCAHCSTTFSRKDKLSFHMKKHEDAIN